jgi:hypothetical protein
MTTQSLTDVGFTFQCCMASKLDELIKKEYISNICIKELDRLKEMNMYFKALKSEIYRRKNEEEINQIKDSKVVKLINILKIYCNECCINII